jgi:hypothetical protein
MILLETWTVIKGKRLFLSVQVEPTLELNQIIEHMKIGYKVLRIHNSWNHKILR